MLIFLPLSQISDYHHLTLRNEFLFSEAYRSVTCIGSRAKGMEPEGVHLKVSTTYVNAHSVCATSYFRAGN